MQLDRAELTTLYMQEKAMKGDRKAATAELLAGLEALLPGSENTALYKAKLESMSDAEFDDWIKGLEEGTQRISVIVPNFSKHQIDVERNLNLADKWGYEFFERLWMMGPNGSYFLTPKKYLVYDLPLRRQAQHLLKKISIPEDNKSVDDLTGQPTGKSKGSKLSYPELQVMAALGLDHSIIEMMKVRGGDIRAFNASNAIIAKTGTVSQAEIEPYAGGVESTKTLGTILTAMHLQNTI
jgi:hypothetical protein